MSRPPTLTFVSGLRARSVERRRRLGDALHHHARGRSAPHRRLVDLGAGPRGRARAPAARSTLHADLLEDGEAHLVDGLAPGRPTDDLDRRIGQRQLLPGTLRMPPISRCGAAVCDGRSRVHAVARFGCRAPSKCRHASTWRVAAVGLQRRPAPSSRASLAAMDGMDDGARRQRVADDGQGLRCPPRRHRRRVPRAPSWSCVPRHPDGRRSRTERHGNAGSCLAGEEMRQRCTSRRRKT